MWNSLATGYKLAIGTLAIELLVSLALVSDTLGLFAILAMPFIGMAWLPAALLILSDMRRESQPTLHGYILAIACGVAGMACVGTCLNWTLLAGFAG
jgi:hypothetical protein